MSGATPSSETPDRDSPDRDSPDRDPPDRDPLEQVADSFLARLRAGERPALEEYESKHPELAEDIRELFPALVMMEQGRRCVEMLPAADLARLSEEQVPRQLGEFRLLRQAGRGGMGVVYEAWQESLARHVALKVLPFNSLARPEHLERFRRESRAAARLHHTNIVPVFGVGEHQGIHYYAMQFIHGQGLDAVLEEVRRLRGLARDGSPTSPELATTVAKGMMSGLFADAAARPKVTSHEGDSGSVSGLKLQQESRYYASVARVGLQVAEALEYAHSQGVLHRDIKPSNLLLDTEGRVWITDFGLAKAEDSDVLTETGDILGTVRYMAPERFHGQADTRSDVYGLGMTLYELLTLRPAFEQPNRGMLMEQIAHSEPPRPRKFEPRIPRDLETIVLKTIAKDAGGRYRSAGAVAEDLRRYLADRPIRARRTPWRERAWRWCRRNPGVALLTAALLVVLLSGFAAVAWQWRRAEDNLQTAQEERDEADKQRRQADQFARKAHQAFDDAFTELSESKLIDVPGAQPLRRELLSKAVTYYQDFLRQRSQDPEIQADLAAACFRLATIYISLQQLDEAVAAIQQGLDYVETLYKEHGNDARWPPRLAGFFKNIRVHMTHIHTSKRLPSNPFEAFRTLRRATTMWERLAGENPNLPGLQTDLTLIHLITAGALARANLEEQALATYEKARTVAEQLVRRYPDVSLHQELLTYTYPKMVEILESRGRFEQAETIYRDGLKLFETLAGDSAGPAPAQAQLGVMLYDLGVFLEKRERSGEAEKAFRRSIGLLQKSVDRHPRHTEARRDLAHSYQALGRVLNTQPQEAEKALHQALAQVARLEADFPGVASYQLLHAGALWQLGDLLERSRPEKAEEAYHHSLLIYENLVAAFPETSDYWNGLARGFRAVASLVESRRRQDVANVCRDALGRFTRLRGGSSADPGSEQAFRRLVAFTNRTLGYHAVETSPAEAAKAARRAVDIMTKLTAESSAPEDREELGHSYFSLARALQHGHRFPEAEEAYGQAARVFAKLTADFRSRPSYRHYLAITYSYTGNLHEAKREPALAAKAYRQAICFYERLAAEVQSEEDYQRELAHNCHLCLGRLLLDDRRFEAAEKPLRQALVIWEKLGNRNPPDMHLIHLQRCYTALIQVFLATGRPDEASAMSKRALATLEKLAVAHPNSAHHRVLVGWFLVTCPDVRIWDHDRALTIIRKEIEQEPRNGFFRLSLAVALYRARDWKGTIDSLEAANLLYAGDSWPWFFLAMTHWQRGDRDAARSWYDKAVEWMEKNQPRDEELRQFRAEASRLLGIAGVDDLHWKNHENTKERSANGKRP